MPRANDNTCGSRAFFGRQTPRHGADTLVTVLHGEPETLDPTRCSESLGGEVVHNLFAGLVQYAPGSSQALVGDVAERWSYDAEHLRWRFFLRRTGWSDGRPVLAQHFVDGILRALAPTTASRSATLLYVIRGAQAFAEGQADKEAVGVRAVGDQLLEIELAAPTPYFLHLCAHSLVRPIPSHLLAALARAGQDPAQWSRPEHLVANGAYALTRWRFKRDFWLHKNPHYWDAAQVAIAKVHVLLVENDETAVLLYRAAELDLLPGHISNVYQRALARSADYVSTPSLTSAFYWLNTRRPPLDDRRVRRALSLAIDRAALVAAILPGSAAPSTTLVPDGLGGYSAPKASGFDPEQARACLRAAGFGPGQKSLRPLRLVYNTADVNAQVAQAVQAMWQTHLGIEVTLENQEWRVYLSNLENKDFDVARMGWQGDYPDADNFLRSVFSPAAGNNLSGWQDPRLDALLAAAGRCQDTGQRLRLLARAEQLALSAQPLLPLYLGTDASLVKSYVRGFAANVLLQHAYKDLRLLPPGGPGAAAGP